MQLSCWTWLRGCHLTSLLTLFSIFNYLSSEDVFYCTINQTSATGLRGISRDASLISLNEDPFTLTALLILSWFWKWRTAPPGLPYPPERDLGKDWVCAHVKKPQSDAWAHLKNAHLWQSSICHVVVDIALISNTIDVNADHWDLENLRSPSDILPANVWSSSTSAFCLFFTNICNLIKMRLSTLILYLYRFRTC